MFIDSIIDYCKDSKGLQIEDVFKYVYQSSFGCEHLVEDFDFALKKINDELQNANKDLLEKIEMIDGDFCRIHLKIIDDGLSAETLCRLFVLSAQTQKNGRENLEKKLEELTVAANEKKIPFGEDELEDAIEKWKANGYPPVHHSEKFKSIYHPAYRVIKKEFAQIIPLLIEIDKKLKKGRTAVAIEGRCASGKTTLTKLLKEIYGCNVFHMDDFFLTPEMKTEERLSVAGENIDHERFLREVLVPLSENKPIEYRRYNCHDGKIEESVTNESNRLNIVEGVYCFHSDLIGYYDLKVFLDITSKEQRERILKRNTLYFVERFFNVWIPLEEKYFKEQSVREKADIVITL